MRLHNQESEIRQPKRGRQTESPEQELNRQVKLDAAVLKHAQELPDRRLQRRQQFQQGETLIDGGRRRHTEREDYELARGGTAWQYVGAAADHHEVVRDPNSRKQQKEAHLASIQLENHEQAVFGNG